MFHIVNALGEYLVLHTPRTVQTGKSVIPYEWSKVRVDEMVGDEVGAFNSREIAERVIRMMGSTATKVSGAKIVWEEV